MPVLAIARSLPWPFAWRLGLALAEVVLAAATLVGSVIVGHELSLWRDWYGNPATPKIWAPTARPSSSHGIDVVAPWNARMRRARLSAGPSRARASARYGLTLLASD